MNKKFVVGVHNDQYNLDYYDDGTLEIFDYKKEKLITTFPRDTFDLLLRLIKRQKDEFGLIIKDGN